MMAVDGRPTIASPKADDPHSSEKARAKDKLFLLFGLRDQQLLEDYSCAIKDKILLHGRLYVTSSLVAFYSSIFGHETRKVLPFTRVVSISKVRVGLIPMLQFTLRLANGDHKRVMFTSFFGHYMEDCTALCTALHRQHRPDRYKLLSPDGKREGESGSSERGRASTLDGTGQGQGGIEAGVAAVPVVDLACNNVQASAASIRRAAKLQAVSALPISPSSVATGSGMTHKHLYKQDGFVSTADGSLYRQASDTDVESDEREYSGSGIAHASAEAGGRAEGRGSKHGHSHGHGQGRLPSGSPFSEETPAASASGPFGNRDRAHTTAGLSEAEKRAFASSTATAHRRVSRHRPSMSSPDASSQGQGGAIIGKHAAQKSTMVYLHTSSSPSGIVGRDRSASAVLDVHTGLHVDHTSLPPLQLPGRGQGKATDGRDRLGTDGTVGDSSIPASEIGHEQVTPAGSRANSVVSGPGAGTAGGDRADISPSRVSNVPRVHSDTELDRMHHDQRMSERDGISHQGQAHSGEDVIRHSKSSTSLKGHVQWQHSEYAAPGGDAADTEVDSGSWSASATPRPGEPDVTDQSITDHSPTPESFDPVPADVWPRLGRMKLLTDIVLPMTVSACERSFLLDSAVFSVGDAHKAWGDKDIQQGKWTDAEHHVIDSPDKTPGGSSVVEPHAHHARVLTRALRLVMPLQGMGPLMAAQTDVEKVQRLSRYSMEVASQGKGRFLLMESSARSFQVPYGDYFLTEEAIVLSPATASLPIPSLPELQQDKVQQGKGLLPSAQQSAGSSTSESSSLSSWTRVLIFVRVNFQKSTLFKGKIVSETEKRTLAFAEAYCLKMQEQTRAILFKEAEESRDSAAAAAQAASGAVSGRTSRAGSASSHPSSPRLRARRRAAQEQAALTKGSPPGSGGSSPSSGPAEFISPTAAAAMANPSLAIPKDELLASILSPTDAAGMNQQKLSMAYMQLYATHAATVSQVRHLREQVATLSASRGSTERDRDRDMDRSWGRADGTPSRGLPLQQGMFAWDRSSHPGSERGAGANGSDQGGGSLSVHASGTPVRRQLAHDLVEDALVKPAQVRSILENLVLGLISVAMCLGILVLWRGLSEDTGGITTFHPTPDTLVPEDVKEEIIRELLQRLKG